MNEQEYMNQIKKQTENVKIPESISPENMKKMLEENAGANTQTNTTIRKQRHWAKYTVAACVALLVVGGTGFSFLKLQHKSSSADNDVYTDELGAESAPEDSKDTAYKTAWNTPGSYDDYYDTIKASMDEYYDSFAEVETSDIASYDAKEAAMPEAAADSLQMADYGAAMASEDRTDYSTTNTQEENIDEGDIIKTDGTYIYKVTKVNNGSKLTNSLSIIHTDNGKMKLESTIDLDNCLEQKDDAYVYFSEFYLYKNNLILLFTSDYDKTETKIVIYDIKDKSNPTRKKILSQSGNYNSSRISNGVLYTISNFSGADFTTKEPYSNYIPSVNGDLIDCGQIIYPDDVFVQSTYVVTGTDIDSCETTDQAAVPTSGGNVYMSDKAIYLYGPKSHETNKTEFLRIAYQDGKLTPGGSAVVSGHLYDSFAVSEYNGYLRIITTISPNNISLFREDDILYTKEAAVDTATEDDTEEPTESINVLYILNENMEPVSKLSGIAPGEDVKAVRFMGDMGYLVTYENTDPLFAIDLSDPENPKIKGKLTVPGFSNYLHLYEDGLLLGLGEEYTPQDQTYVGLKMTMFDISNPVDIKAENQLIIENAYYSSAQNNHKALMIDTEKNLFGFFYQEQIEGNDYSYTTNNYYVTYSYDKENGFTETGRYKVDMESYEVDEIRGVYIGDYLYISTCDTTTSYQLNTSTQIAKLNY